MTKKKRKYIRKRRPTLKSLSPTLELKALASWANTLKGCLHFLTELSKLKPGPGEGWARGNRTYYLKLTHQLLDNVPKGAEAAASEARKMLDSLES